MTQIATVTALPGGAVVEVTVVRKTACGHNCENCAGCGSAGAGSFTVLAAADIPVSVGDRVEIYTGGRILTVAAVVYLLPVMLFLACYFLTPGFSEMMRYILGGVGFAAGVAAAVIYDRHVGRQRTITYHIIRKL